MRSLLGDVHGLELPPEVPPLLQEVDGLLRLPAHHAPVAATLRGAPVATPNQLATQSEIWGQNIVSLYPISPVLRYPLP